MEPLFVGSHLQFTTVPFEYLSDQEWMRYPLCFFSEIWWWVFYKSDWFYNERICQNSTRFKMENKDIILIVTQINYWKVLLLIGHSLRYVRWKFKKTPPLPNFKITKHQRSTINGPSVLFILNFSLFELN